MSRFKKLVFALLILITGLAVGCKKNDVMEIVEDLVTSIPTVTPMIYESIIGRMIVDEYPIVDGSTATLPLSQAVYQLATGATKEEANRSVVHTKTSNSYYRLFNGEVDLLIVYEPSPDVLDYMKENQIEMEIKEIGKDALVFMTNSENPVESLSQEQIQKIYSGQINNWREVGGEDKELLAFQRPLNSGSQTLMQKLVMGDLKMVEGDNIIRYVSMADIIDGMVSMGKDANTLGYSVYYYAQNMYQQPELKFVAVDGVLPSNQSIQDSSYPYVNGFYAVVRKNEPKDSNARRIFEWLTMEEGQSLINSLGYVPVKQVTTNEAKTEMKDTEISIPEGYVYMTTSYTEGNEIMFGRVNLYRDNWELIKSFDDAYVGRDAGLRKADEKLVIELAVRNESGTYEPKHGLYSIEQEKFIIPPIYENLHEMSEDKGYYYAVKINENEAESCVIDESQKVIQKGLPTDEVFHLKSALPYGYWYFDYKYNFFNQDWKKILTIETNNEEGYAEELYTFGGSLLLNRKLFTKKLGIKDDLEADFYIERYQPFLYDYEYLFIVHYDDTYYLMNREGKILESSFYDISYEFYKTNEESNYYTKDGEILTGPTGHYYNQMNIEWFSEQAVFSRTEGKFIYIWPYDNEIEYQLDVSDLSNPVIDDVCKDYWIVSDGTNKIIFYKDNRIMELEDYCYFLSYYNENGLSKVLYSRDDNDNDRYYILRDGKLQYQFKENEELIQIDDTFIQLVQGNYNIVMDYSGNYMVRELHFEYIND